MRICKDAGLAIVLLLDDKPGEEFSADYGDYFMMPDDEEIPGAELAVKEIKVSYRDPTKLLDKQS